MADQTVVTPVRTLAPVFDAFPPAIGAGAGNNNDINVPATAAPRARVGAVVVPCGNRGDDGHRDVVALLTAAFALGFSTRNLGSITATAQPPVRAMPGFGVAPALSIGQGPMPTPAFSAVLSLPNRGGVDWTISAPAALALGLGVPIAPSIEVDLLVPVAQAVGFGVAPTFTFTQSPVAQVAVSVAFGVRAETNTFAPSVPADALSQHVYIRANPRGGPARAKRS